MTVNHMTNALLIVINILFEKFPNPVYYFANK